MRAILTLAVAALALATSASSQTTREPTTVDAAYAAALEVSATPLQLAADQADWAREHTRMATDGGDAAWDAELRVERLNAYAQRDRLMRYAVVEHQDVSRPRCAATGIDGCHAYMGGFIASRDDILHWQLQSGHTEDDGIRNGIVFFGDARAARVGPVKPVAWSFDAARFDPPVLLNGDETGALIVVPGIHSGTGGGVADVMFRWRPGEDAEMTQIDTWSWRDDLAARLPEGLSIGRGVRIDYHEMFAVAPLSTPSDGGCCSTGGTALIDLEVRGDRLTVSDVRVQRAGEG